ncbi:hypothetical protein G6F57_023477 [Rhizopus arrhizus]|nr:hypothetical protein G6F59_019003 [Rhizopus arrhizus]KAG1423815.1 hypothetical protein G6F57_023477 [Rhizopus arrhizus]
MRRSRAAGKADDRRQLNDGMSCANAGVLTAAPVATAPSPACFKNERRCISLLLTATPGTSSNTRRILHGDIGVGG